MGLTLNCKMLVDFLQFERNTLDLKISLHVGEQISKLKAEKKELQRRF